MKELKLYLTRDEIISIALDLRMLQGQDIGPLTFASQKILELDKKLEKIEDVLENEN